MFDDLLGPQAGNTKAFKDLVISLYAYSLKGICRKKDRDKQISLTDVEILLQSNQYYCDWKNKYNRYNTAQYKEFLVHNGGLAEAIKDTWIVRMSEKCKTGRKLKKWNSRIYRDISKTCRLYGYSVERCPEFHKALKVGSHAYKREIIDV